MKGDHITRGLFVIASGQAGRLALGFVASVLLARSLGAADFGVYGVLGAMSAVLLVVADMGLATTVAQRVGAVGATAVGATDKTGAQQLGRVFFWLRLLLVLLVVGMGLLFSRPLTQFLFGDEAATQMAWVQLALLGVMVTSLSSSMTALLRATGHFRRINLVVLTNAGLTAVTAVILAFMGYLNLFTALVVLGIGTALVASLLGSYLLPAPLDIRLPNRTSWRAEWPRFLRFSRWLGFSAILAICTRQLDMILVNRWVVDTAVVGAYALALNLAAKLELLNYSQYTVLTPAMAALPDAGNTRQFVLSRLHRNGLIVLALLPVWALAGPFILFFYGEEFATAVPLFRLLFFLVLFDFMVLPITLLFLPREQPHRLALADGLQLLAFLGLAAWLVPLHGPVGAILAKAGGRLTGFGVSLLLLRR